MANQAQKKNKQSSDQWSAVLTPLFIFLQTVAAGFILYNGITIWLAVWFGLYCGVLNTLRRMIISEVEQGLTPGYTFDVFVTIAAS